jgi:uncharacterized BrkB/YihY/UPF0761 family membrane protein
MASKKEVKEIGEGLGISGFTLGILSIVLAGFLGFVLSIIGFIFSRVQQKRNPTKLARVGVILNVIGFVISAILTTIFVISIYQAVVQGSFPAY